MELKIIAMQSVQASGHTVQHAVDLLSAFSEEERFTQIYTGGPVAVFSDASHLVCTCGDTLNVLDVETGNVAIRIAADPDEFTSFALHPSQPEIVAATRSRQVQHYKLDTITKTSSLCRTWKAHKMPIIDLAYESTGTLVASASADTTVMVFDVNKGFCTHVFRGHEGVVHRGK